LTLINNYFVICAIQWDVQDKGKKKMPHVEVVPVVLCMGQQDLLFAMCFWSVWSLILESRLATPEVLQCRQHEVWDLYYDDYGDLLFCGMWCV